VEKLAELSNTGIVEANSLKKLFVCR